MRILITNFWLHKFDESETFCFELIERCKAQGHDVEIYAIDIDAAMRSYCSINEIVLHDANSTFSSTQYDVLWMHHNVVPRDFLISSKSKVSANRVVSHRMSAFDPNDIPLFPSMESALADRVLASSFDVKIQLTEMGFDENQVTIIGSPVPKEFIVDSNPTAQLNRFLFISNDPPKNVLAAVEMLETIGFEVRRIERKQFVGNRNWISPSDLEWADAIISIEESIPYAVLSHRPIYLYNKFSGLGWVLDDSELNATYLRGKNAGTDISSLSVSSIVEQLLSEFEDARNYINGLDADSTRRFHFEPMLDEVLNDLDNSQDKTEDAFERISYAEKTSWLAVQDIFIREVQARRYADASARQALQERSIVLEKLAGYELHEDEVQDIESGAYGTEYIGLEGNQKKFSITSRVLK
jgi:hypothetical protein